MGTEDEQLSKFRSLSSPALSLTARYESKCPACIVVLLSHSKRHGYELVSHIFTSAYLLDRCRRMLDSNYLTNQWSWNPLMSLPITRFVSH